MLTISDPNGSPNSVDVNPLVPPSLSFSFTVNFNATDPTTGITFFLETPLAGGGSGKFQITQRLLTGNPYDVPSTSNTGVLATGSLAPRNGSDLGATLSDPFNPVPPGIYPVGIFTIQVSPNIAAGDYIIQTAVQGATSADFFDDLPVQGASYTVHVVPEPMLALQLCLGSAVLSAFHRPRRVQKPS